jgi:signal transduction histidine kinase
VQAHDSLRGVGLLGMRERLEILGGSLRIDSEPGGGTRVVMTVPMAAAA